MTTQQSRAHQKMVNRRRLRVSEVRKALTAIRKQTTKCGASATYQELYENAEALQDMAFDFKQLAAHGGTWNEWHE